MEAGKELRAEAETLAAALPLAEPVAQVDAGADELTSDRTCPTATTQKNARDRNAENKRPKTILNSR